MSMKLVQKHFLKGSREFEIADDVLMFASSHRLKKKK